MKTTRLNSFSRLFCGALLLSACSPRSAHDASSPAPSSANGSITSNSSGKAAGIDWKGRPSGVTSTDGTLKGGHAIHPLGQPQDVIYSGGPVISDVNVVAVYWSGAVDGTLQSTLPGFYSAVTASGWIDRLAEYNTPSQAICRGSFAGTLTITPVNTHTTLLDADIQTELAAQLQAGNIDPQPDANTLYMIHFPPGYTVKLPVEEDGNIVDIVSCVDFCAYHSSFNPHGKQIRYAVMPDLGANGPCATGCGTGTPLQNETSAASHELAETVTDPDFGSGWTNPNPDDQEIGDSCNHVTGTLPGTSFTVQKLWSNANGGCFVTTPQSVVSPPRISGIAPSNGPYNAANGTVITGTCFNSPSVTVAKNGSMAPGSIASFSATRTNLNVTLPTAPDGTPGDGTLTLTNSGNATAASTTFSYTSMGPSMVDINQLSGPMQGGTAVTISGQGFAVWPGVTTVKFGSTAATSVNCTSSTTCIAYSPAHDPAVVNVSITANGSTAVAVNQFTYLGPIVVGVSPDFGPITGGTVVQLIAYNLTDTSVNTFYATANIGPYAAGQVLCERTGLNDGLCTMTTPTIPGNPGSGLDVQLTVANSVTHTPVTSAKTGGDIFYYAPLAAPMQLYFTGAEVGGATVTGTVVLDGKAPSPNGAQVTLGLQSGAPAGVINLPPTMTVPAGAVSGTFQVPIVNQTFTGSIPVYASYGGFPVDGALNITPTPAPTLSAIPQLCSGQAFTETITFAEPVPASGAILNLTSNNPLVTVPTTLQLGSNVTSATFQIVTGSTTTAQPVSISASYFGIASNTVNTQLLPAAAVSLVMSPSSVTGGQSSTGTVTLCSPASGSVGLSSTSAYASVPGSVPINGTTASFSTTTSSVLTNQSVNITATFQGSSAHAPLTIIAAPHCAAGLILCNCGNGIHTCVKTSQQCFTYCNEF